MQGFQKVLFIILVLALIYWVYSRYFSDRREGRDAPPVPREIPEQVVPRETPEQVVPRVEEPAREEEIDSPPEQEEAVRVREPPVPAVLVTGDGEVSYPVDFAYEPKRSEARFLHDPDSGARVWVSGGLPQDHFTYQGEVRNGLAHGDGVAVLRVGPRDHSPNQIQGRFRDGLFMGEGPFPNPIVALLSNDFLIQLPSPREDDARFWLQRGFYSDSITLGLCLRGYSPNLLVEAPSGLSATEEDAVRDLMTQAYRTYCGVCGKVREAWVLVVPREHRRVADGNRTEFEPMMARAQVAEPEGREAQFYSYYNPDAEAAKKRRDAERREEERRREEEQAPQRGRPDVRGLRLGMSIEQVRENLGEDVAEWEGPQETPAENRRYHRPVLKIRLKDGTLIKADFTSRVSGSQMFLLLYTQNYREGVKVREIIRKLEQKYGEPDRADRRGSGPYRASYGLVSAIHPPNKAFGQHGAFFKVQVNPDREKSGFAEKLEIVFNDATLGYHDKGAIRDDRQEAARREFEESRSNEVKF